jgi:hypothetical protein
VPVRTCPTTRRPKPDHNNTIKSNCLWNYSPAGHEARSVLCLRNLFQTECLGHSERFGVRCPPLISEQWRTWEDWMECRVSIWTDLKARSSLLWDVTQCWLAVSHRRFGTTYRSHLQGSSTTFPLISLQLHGPATALSRKFLHDLRTTRHFRSFLKHAQ